MEMDAAFHWSGLKTYRMPPDVGSFVIMNDENMVQRALEFLALQLLNVPERVPPYVIEALTDSKVRDQVLYEARRNRVLFRSLSTLLERRDIPSQLVVDLRPLLEQCWKRIRGTLQITAQVQGAMDRKGVGFCIFKSVPDFPDLNAEIDVLVRGEARQVADEALRSLEPVSVGKGSWETPDKLHYVYSLDGEEYDVELYPRFTEYGEVYIPDDSVIDRARMVALEGTEVRCPTVEDELLVVCTHTMYRHGGIIKLSDVVAAVRMLRDQGVDLGQTYDNARLCGVTRGLDLFLSWINGYYETRFGNTILPPSMLSRLPDSNVVRASAIAFPYRFSAMSVTCLLMDKVYQDLKQRRLSSAYAGSKTLATKFASRVLYTAFRLTKQEQALKRFGWA